MLGDRFLKSLVFLTYFSFVECQYIIPRVPGSCHPPVYESCLTNGPSLTDFNQFTLLQAIVSHLQKYAQESIEEPPFCSTVPTCQSPINIRKPLSFCTRTLLSSPVFKNTLFQNPRCEKIFNPCVKKEGKATLVTTLPPLSHRQASYLLKWNENLKKQVLHLNLKSSLLIQDIISLKYELLQHLRNQICHHCRVKDLENKLQNVCDMMDKLNAEEKDKKKSTCCPTNPEFPLLIDDLETMMGKLKDYMEMKNQCGC